MSVKLATDEDLITIVASGPYMTNGTIQTDQLELLVDVVKAKNAHVLILVCINWHLFACTKKTIIKVHLCGTTEQKLGPFVDMNNDLIASGDIQFTFEELLQNVMDKLAAQLNGYFF